MTCLSRATRLSFPVLISALTLSLALAGTGHAKKLRAFKTFKSGQSAQKAFRSLARHRPVKAIYRTNKSKHKVGKSVNDMHWNVAVAPIAAGNVAVGGYHMVKYGGMIGDAISRGNQAEIWGTVAVTGLVTLFTAGNVWLSRANFKAMKQSFSQARLKKNLARKDTINKVIGSPTLQKKINGGKVFTAPERQSLTALANAL